MADDRLRALEKIRGNVLDAEAAGMGRDLDRVIYTHGLMTGTSRLLLAALDAVLGPQDRVQLGRTVREAWMRWAAEQPAPKPSWLVPWEELDDGQREVDMRIGEAIAAYSAAAITRELLGEAKADG